MDKSPIPINGALYNRLCSVGKSSHLFSMLLSTSTIVSASDGTPTTRSLTVWCKLHTKMTWNH